MQPEQIELEYEILQHQKWLKNPREGTQLAHIRDLFMDLRFTGLHLKNAILSENNIIDSVIYRSDFENCNFKFTSFSGCLFRNVTFKKCDFSFSSWENSCFQNCRFHDCNLLESKLEGNYSEDGGFVKSILKNCNLKKLRFNNVFFNIVQFDQNNFENIEFRNVLLNHVSFLQNGLMGDRHLKGQIIANRCRFNEFSIVPFGDATIIKECNFS